MLGLHCDVATDTAPTMFQFVAGDYIMTGIPVAPFDMVEITNEAPFVTGPARIYVSRTTLADGNFYGFSITGPVNDISMSDNPFWLQGEQMGDTDQYIFRYCKFDKPFTLAKVNFSFYATCTMSAERFSRLGPLPGVTLQDTVDTDTFVSPNVGTVWDHDAVMTYVTLNLTPRYAYFDLEPAPTNDLTPGDITPPEED